jgi:hypothetical protein
MTDRTEAMGQLIAQDADLIDVASKVTEADRDAAAHFWQKSFDGDFYTLPQAFARHRQQATEAQAAEIERLREALEYYAQELMTGPWGIDSLDFGDVARAALEQSK